MAGIGLPLEALGHDVGSLVVGTPALDETSVHVHDPVFGDMLPLVQPQLHLPIGAGRTRRQHLDGEQ
jgi:hypothetical protein